MAERRPDPPDPRASLVDSGWSEAPVPSERELPAYEDVAREALVTRVDDQIQARIAAMNYDDKTEVTSAPRAAPAPAKAAAAPAPAKAAAAPLGSRTQRRPPPLSAPPTAPPASAPATVRKPSAPPTPVPVAPAPLELLSAPTEERTLVDSQPPTGTRSSSPPPPPRRPSQMPPPPKPRSAPPPRRASVPPPLPVPQLPPIPAHPLHPTAAAPAQPAVAVPAPGIAPAAVAAAPVVAPPLPPPSLPPPRPVSVPPPALPSFAPMPAAPAVPSFETAPSLGQALSARVRVVGMETPLWGVLVPLLGATAIVAALAAGLVATSTRDPEGVSGAPSASAEASSAAASSPASAPQAGDAATVPASGSLVERARSGDASALASLEQKKPADRSVEEALGLAAGKVAQAAAAAAKLRARLAADPGLAKDPKVVADLRKFAQDPATSRDALAAMAAVPGPLSADLLYEAWTSTAERSETTELAQALLMSHDVRPKASPALAVALDLREAESCEANAKILPRAIEVGDKRAFAPLSRLLRHNGCGPTKRDDCYVCIRDGDLLTKALSTVKQRREPDLVRRDTPAH